MTEAEWLTCAEPVKMLDFLHGTVSDRKLRLWACAFASWYADGRGYLIEAVRVAERWADGDPPVDLGPHAQFYVCFPSAWRAAQEGSASTVAYWAESGHKRRTTRLLLDNVQCVFGNPFRPVAVDPSWLTPTVVALADAIYADRAFDRLPVLADALEEAGCDHPDVLAHCRGDGPHVRGCWVVDLVLGKG